MIRITTIIGARPQFIKASVMSRCFSASEFVEEVLVHTGQHFDYNMSDVFFTQLKIPAPKYNLGIHNAPHGKMTGQMLMGIENVLMEEKPDYVLVYGDTNSTLAGALAAKKLNIPVIHVEAGLRSRNNKMPEEINRILTDRISDLLCCPTDTALENLRLEGFKSFDASFQKTGDVMEDALKYYERFEDTSGIIDRLQVAPEKYVLCTVHRAENTDIQENLSQIMEALVLIADQTDVVLPLHPRTRSILKSLPHHKNLHLIDPVGYLECLHLIKEANMVLTDSGGMQKEAYMFKKFCITLRDETEWTELTALSCNFLTGAKKKLILETYNAVQKLSWQAPDDLYGGGKAHERIYDMILMDARKRGII
ncbi:MAG: UDP-N-acetylglucosamine 2-epimerase (non-hydrolyzing) [Chryseosolibacter sp.]